MKIATDARYFRPSKAGPRRSRWGTFAWVGQFALLGLVTVAAADRPHFDSHPRDGAITIDGRFDDWSGSLEPFGNDPVSIQVLNDGEFLYLRLVASDAGARTQIMRQGLTVWLDPSGGTKKTLGIRYPVVERGSSGEDGSRGGRGGGYGGRGGRARPGEAGESGPDDATTPSDRVDILGPGKKEAHSLMRDHLPGVDVAVRMEQGTLQYELKVPLAKTADRPYAIGAQPGKTIGLGLETAKVQQSSSGSGRGGGYGGGGGGGMGGRGGGGMGGRGGGGMGRGGGGGGERSFQPPKPLKGWATVTLHGNAL